MNTQAILKEIKEKLDTYAHESTYHDGQIIYYAEQHLNIMDDIDKILTAQEGESKQQYSNRKVKEYISGHGLSSREEKLLFRVARWLNGPTIITDFPMRNAKPLPTPPKEGE